MLLSTSLDGTIRMWPVRAADLAPPPPQEPPQGGAGMAAAAGQQAVISAIVVSGRGRLSPGNAPLVTSVLPPPPPPPPTPAAAAGDEQYEILCGSFSYSGTRFAIGGSDQRVRVWLMEPLLANAEVRFTNSSLSVSSCV